MHSEQTFAFVKFASFYLQGNEDQQVLLLLVIRNKKPFRCLSSSASIAFVDFII
jgi:hypothetical protein